MIDIIIPAYNCSKTLDRTLGSLIAQTDSNFQVTIVDDCSTENIKNIIDYYTPKLNIKYIRNEKNLGCGMSRQVGIDNTTNKYFCFLDSDDVFMPYAVETFNSTIEAFPNIEYLHSYFYEQMLVDGNPALVLKKDGFTWCHGKLYNRELIEKFGIKNSPIVRWADDSFFNSMCTELMEMQIIKVPLMLWCNNKESVTRKNDPERDLEVKKDFLTAITMSVDFVLQYKDKIEHLDSTIEYFLRQQNITEKELDMIKNLSKYTRKE